MQRKTFSVAKRWLFYMVKTTSLIKHGRDSNLRESKIEKFSELDMAFPCFHFRLVSLFCYDLATIISTRRTVVHSTSRISRTWYRPLECKPLKKRFWKKTFWEIGFYKRCEWLTVEVRIVDNTVLILVKIARLLSAVFGYGHCVLWFRIPLDVISVHMKYQNFK